MKKLFAILMTLILCLSFTACGDKKTDNNTKNDTEKKETNVDTEKKEEIPPTDLSASPYLIRYATESKDTDSGYIYGYVDIRTGQIAIEAEYEDADASFNDSGYAVVADKNEDQFLIDTYGNVVTDIPDGGYGYFYEGKYLVVFDDENCGHIYSGTDKKAELKLPMQDMVSAGPTTVLYNRKSVYVPARFILTYAKSSNENIMCYWFDESGKLIYETDSRSGCLLGDETGYYYINDTEVTAIDSNCKVTGTTTINGDGMSQVDYDGEKWYIKNNKYIYTNGFTVFTDNAEDIYNGISNYFDVNDGIIVTGDYVIDAATGERLVSGGSGAYRNGYLEVSNAVAHNYVAEQGYSISGYLDSTGKMIYKPDFSAYGGIDNLSHVFPGGYFCFSTDDDLFGIMNIDGTLICSPQYAELYDFF